MTTGGGGSGAGVLTHTVVGAMGGGISSTGETWITNLDLFQMALQDLVFFWFFLVVVN